MNNESLFSMALGLQSPWKVEEIIFSNDNILDSIVYFSYSIIGKLQFKKLPLHKVVVISCCVYKL
ncbi:hypothetical protein [Bathymodiolus platifrons methanotrophic gill symbiont]|uniref:hypothetical protein n=1 Tax=Bathymodiolus platifrons methanotrophic gill symbiont TaxID=113268 RepID=UPI000B40E4EB|nr:hypothetical protein [Bathymodiolus platifrons methanotrophic gill symbiont]